MSESALVQTSYIHAICQSEGCPVVRFSRRAMEGILAEVSTVFASVPRRGAEAGGILLGRHTGGEIVIEDFEPVPCEHRFGPSYRLSEADRPVMEETLAWFRSGAHPFLSVLGYFRSNTRPEFALSADDERIIDTHFPAAETVILLLQPTRTRDCTADFFFRREERFQEASRPAPFPFTDAQARPLPADSAAARIVELKKRFAAAPVPPAATARELPEITTAPLEITIVPPELGPAASGPAAFLPPKHLPRASRAELEPPPRRQRFWIALAVVLAAAGGLLGYVSLQSQDSSEALAAVPPATPKASPITAASLTPPPTTGSADRIAGPPTDESSPDGAIRGLLNRWSNALKGGDLEEAAECYAARVGTYFGQRGVTREDILRGLRQALAASRKYDIHRISGLKIKTVADNRAVATFRKRWQISGSGKAAGDERERVTLARVQGAWQIVAEQDEKVYWAQRPR